MKGRRTTAVRGTCTAGSGSGSPNLFFDLKNNVFFRRDDKNIAFEVTQKQLPALQGVAVADLFLTKDHIREPHWHPNAGELDVIIDGEVTIAILDPDTPQLITYHVGPGQSVFIPTGWWHWITCISKEAHLHVIFNNANPDTVEGSDVLRLTPPEVFQLAYNVNAKKLEKVLAPIDQTVVIGPPESDHACERDHSYGDGDSSDHSYGDVDSSDHSYGDADSSDHSYGDADSSDHSYGDGDSSDHSYGDGDSSGHSYDDGETSGHTHGKGDDFDHRHGDGRRHGDGKREGHRKKDRRDR